MENRLPERLFDPTVLERECGGNAPTELDKTLATTSPHHIAGYDPSIRRGIIESLAESGDYWAAASISLHGSKSYTTQQIRNMTRKIEDRRGFERQYAKEIAQAFVELDKKEMEEIDFDFGIPRGWRDLCNLSIDPGCPGAHVKERFMSTCSEGYLCRGFNRRYISPLSESEAGYNYNTISPDSERVAIERADAYRGEFGIAGWNGQDVEDERAMREYHHDKIADTDLIEMEARA